MRLFLGAAIALLVVTGCDSPIAEPHSVEAAAATGALPITCEWLAGPNCWKVAIAGAQACAPPPDKAGTFAQGRSRCFFEPESMVFKRPVPESPARDHLWSFGFWGGKGQRGCGWIEASTDALSVESAVGRFTMTRGEGVEIVCPDGSRYVHPNARDLEQCDGGQLPGYEAWSASDGRTVFSLTGADGPLWSCR